MDDTSILNITSRDVNWDFSMDITDIAHYNYKWKALSRDEMLRTDWLIWYLNDESGEQVVGFDTKKSNTLEPWLYKIALVWTRVFSWLAFNVY